MSMAGLEWPRHTQRLVLRAARVEDAQALWAWHRLPEVTYWMTRLADDQEAFTAHFVSHLDRTLVGDLDGRPVVSAKVDVQDPWAQAEVAAQAAGTMAEIGWAVDPAWQGQGLATELAQELLALCFEGLRLHRVVAECFAENVASARVMERVGMRREASYRANSLHRDGTWRDSLTYAMLADEWFAARTVPSPD